MHQMLSQTARRLSRQVLAGDVETMAIFEIGHFEWYSNFMSQYVYLNEEQG